MSGQHHERRCQFPVSQRNLGRCRRAERGRHAGNNFKFDVGLAQGFDFFPGASEDQRISTLQADHLQPHERELHQ